MKSTLNPVNYFLYNRAFQKLYEAIRPETSTVVARRLIAANVDSKIAKQIRAAVEEEAIIKVFARRT